MYLNLIWLHKDKKIDRPIAEIVNIFVKSKENLKLIIKILYKATNSSELKELYRNKLPIDENQTNILLNNYDKLANIFHGNAGLEKHYKKRYVGSPIPSLLIQKEIIIKQLIKKSVAHLKSNSKIINKNKKQQLNALARKLLNRSRLVRERNGSFGTFIDFILNLFGKVFLITRILPYINRLAGKYLSINLVGVVLRSIICNFREIFWENTSSDLDKLKLFLIDIIFGLIPIIILPFMGMHPFNIYTLNDLMYSFKDLYKDFTEKQDSTFILQNIRVKSVALTMSIFIFSSLSLNSAINVFILYLFLKNAIKRYDSNAFWHNKTEKLLYFGSVILSCLWNLESLVFTLICTGDVKNDLESPSELITEHENFRVFTQSLTAEIAVESGNADEKLYRL